VTVGFVMPARLSVCLSAWSSLALTERVFTKCGI
jgi:hypothetical protein